MTAPQPRPETPPGDVRWRFLTHVLVSAVALAIGLGSIAPVDPGAPSGAGASVARSLAALSHAAVVSVIVALLAWSISRVARRETAAFGALWGLTGALLGAAYFDSRFLVFFGRHVYHPATIDLISTPGIADQSGVGVERGSLMLVAWIAAIAALARLGHAARARGLGSPKVAGALAIALGVATVGDHLALDAIVGSSWLERYRDALFLRGLTSGRTHAAADDAWPFTYPLGSLGAPAHGDLPDVLFVVVESLRADVLDPETMPETSRHASRGYVGARHYAGANCTANAWFTLLYGTNGTTYARFGDTARPIASAPLAWLRESGYVLELYSSESLEWQDIGPLFMEPVFDEIVVDAEGGEDWERDARLLDHYFARQRSDGRPRFSVVFFTSTHHDYSFPPERAPFQPSLRPLEVMQSDLRPFRTELVNRYRNSVSYVDSLVGTLLDRLESEGRLGRMRVAITGDHGEEFLEHGHLTHASSLVEEQIHTPLVMLGVPGLSGVSDETTSHAQIVPTLLASIDDDLAFASTGTGAPIGRGAHLAIASECASEPGMFVAIDGARKHWFSVDRGSIRLDFVSDAHDVVLADAATDAATLALLREAVGHFGGARATARSLWPCPTVRVGGDEFHLCERWIAWPEAREICRSHGLDLATFTDARQAEAVAAAATAGDHASAWIGLTDREREGDFRWIDGAAPAFTRWAPGEPSNDSGREHCVQVLRDGTWSDRVCESRDVFVCGPRR